MKVRLVFTGRSYPMAHELPDLLELSDGATLDDALAVLADAVPAGPQVPASCLVSVAGEHLGTLARHANPTLHDGDELVLVAPVAGG